MELDATDWKILDLLQFNARVSNVDLARQVGLSPSPCLNRVRALEKGGWNVTATEIRYLAKNFTDLDDTARKEVTAFLTELDDHEDVHRIYAALK